MVSGFNILPCSHPVHRECLVGMIQNGEQVPTVKLFSQLGLIKFMDLVTMQTAVFMFQYYHNLLPKVFDNYFTCISSKHNYNTRLASR